MTAPDYIEPIVGWRLWHVAERDRELRLVSPLYRTAWPPREGLVAVCRHGLGPGLSPLLTTRRQHASPDASCSCGIYASRTPTEAAAYMTRSFKPRADVLQRTIGTVSLWGTIVECDRGWRASRAYPRTIYVPVPKRSRRFLLGGLSRPALPSEEIGRQLASYGVPVEFVECSTLGELAALLESADGRLDRAA